MMSKSFCAADQRLIVRYRFFLIPKSEASNLILYRSVFVRPYSGIRSMGRGSVVMRDCIIFSRGGTISSDLINIPVLYKTASRKYCNIIYKV